MHPLGYFPHGWFPFDQANTWWGPVSAQQVAPQAPVLLAGPQASITDPTAAREFNRKKRQEGERRRRLLMIAAAVARRI